MGTFSLNDSGGAATPVEATLGGWSAIGDPNDATGAFLTTAPHLAPGANDYFYTTAAGTVTFTGLTPEKFYRVEVVSSRSGDPELVHAADITLGGGFADSVPNGEGFEADVHGFADGSLLVWDPIVGRTYGLTLEVKTVAKAGYLNAVRISESAATSGAIYREIFPNATGTQTLADEGWQVHHGSDAQPATGPGIPPADGFDTPILPPVNSDPQGLVNGTTEKGFLYNSHTDTEVPEERILYWTEELTEEVTGGFELRSGNVEGLSFQTRDGTAGDLDPQYTYRLALRVADDWYVSKDFDAADSQFQQTPDDDILWQEATFDMDLLEWAELTFVEETSLEIGASKEDLPNAAVTAFGIFQDSQQVVEGALDARSRLDNFTIVGRWTEAPEPPEPLPGDLNGDGFVGGDDLDIVRSFWGQNVTPGNWEHGDPSGDGFVGGDDLDAVRANWGSSLPPAPGTAVPEPSTTVSLSLLVLAASVLFKRRKSR